MTLFEQRNELFEQAAHSLGFGTFDSDLVAADVDPRAVERLFDGTQQLVTLAQQAHHEVVPGDEDLDLGGRHLALVRRVPGTSLPAGRRAGSYSISHPRRAQGTVAASGSCTSARQGTSAWWPAEPAATEHVEVQMGDAVAGVRAYVQHQARATFGKAVGSRNPPGDVEYLR